MAANGRQIDRRFWKIVGITLTQVLLLTAVTLVLVHFFLGTSPMSRFLFQVTPLVFTGVGIKIAMDKLRKSDSA